MNLFSNIATVGLIWCALYMILKVKDLKQTAIAVLVVVLITVTYLILQSHYPNVMGIIKTLTGIPITAMLIALFVVKMVDKKYEDAIYMLISSMFGVIAISSHLTYLIIVGYLFAISGIYVLAKPLKKKVGVHGKQRYK